ncbi:replication factor A [Halobacterium salinarum]|uniref:replication factor A n=1 Tax=Halobacterium salinarum TaxID=2242 RepID=UPI0025531C54|nr:replication factor A [Halobacterium salinarum]MDL0135812.1 replication factor A [Halobacterium salinarum]MDL0139911.1 replication factor A [Halobacterium salinarum]
MSDSNLRQQPEDIHDQLPDGADVSPGEIEDRLTTLVSDYKVPLDEARRSVISTYLDETDGDHTDIASENQEVDLADIDEPEQWVDVTAKVVDLWEPRSDAIAQVGLLGDETGTIKFTKWAKSDLPELAEGRVYRLGNVVSDEYQGQYSVKLNRTTTIDEVDLDIEVGDNTTEAEGALVDIQNGSGLIKRCPEDDCTRVLQNGRCSEHGEGEGEFDLRIKGVLDDGDTVQEVIFDQEATEQAAGITLEEAQERAMDALDTSVVADDVRDATLGRYYRVNGPVMGRYLLVNEFEQVEEIHDPEEILITARSV